MQAVIYVRNYNDIPIYKQFNICAEYAKRYGYSIKSKVLDFTGSEFYKAVDKVVFDDETSFLIVYDRKCIGDNETVLFYKIYLSKFNKKLLIVT